MSPAGLLKQRKIYAYYSVLRGASQAQRGWKRGELDTDAALGGFGEKVFPWIGEIVDFTTFVL